jgi:ribosome-associated protein
LTATGSRDTALLCVRYALEKKAQDVVVMDVSATSSLADYFVLCSGRSDTQVQAIAQSIEQNLVAHGTRARSIEGLATGQWVLVDFADVIVHVFLEHVREFYDLERLWARAPRITLPEPYLSQARDLRSASAAR